MTATITTGPSAGCSANIERPFELGFAQLSNDMVFYHHAMSPIDTANRRILFRVPVQPEGSNVPRVAVGTLMPEQSTAGDQNLPWHYSMPRQTRRQAHLLTVTEIAQKWDIEPHFAPERNALPASELPPVVREFAEGVDGVRPRREVVAMAVRLVRAAVEHTDQPEITVDDDDGVEFDLRLGNGWLLMANLLPDGKIDVSVYDDSQGIPVKRVKRMPQASEAELVSLFRM